MLVPKLFSSRPVNEKILGQMLGQLTLTPKYTATLHYYGASFFSLSSRGKMPPRINLKPFKEKLGEWHVLEMQAEVALEVADISNPV